ncbi:hypothetical protein D3C86_1260320 [compost metagenome]
MQTTFRHNSNTHAVSLSKKAKDMGIEKLSVKGVRWFQKSYGNTYHTIYISALINCVWQDLGHTEEEHYGYGDHYLVTAGKWLIENGFVDCDESEGYFLANVSVREALNVEHYVQDVKRKRDLW